MKHLPLSLLSLLALAACTQDAYEKGEGKYSLVRADFAEAYVDANLKMGCFVTDDGDSLTASQPYTASWMQTPDSVYRTVVYYNKVKDSRGQDGADVQSVSRVPTAQPHKPFFFESGVKTDPVGLESVWLAKNRRYLNLGLLLKIGTAGDDDDALHSLGMVADTLMAYPDSTHTLCLQLYHDQGGVPEYYSQRTYISIPLRGISADTIRLTLNTYSGLVTKVFPL